MNENIMVAVDGSDASFKALDFAADLASKYGSKLWLVHVVQSREIPEGLKQWARVEHVQSPPEWLLEEAIAENVLTAAADRARAHGVKSVEGVSENGDVARCIIDAVRRHSVDVVVMGTRGLSDLQGLVLGSVAHKVSHAAPCTVITVK
jgi:nucleotide-binding universal stress UspA family protein